MVSDYRKEMTVSRAVHEAIGEASMCWTPRPSGEFDSQMAADVASRLMTVLGLDPDSQLEVEEDHDGRNRDDEDHEYRESLRDIDEH